MPFNSAAREFRVDEHSSTVYSVAVLRDVSTFQVKLRLAQLVCNFSVHISLSYAVSRRIEHLARLLILVLLGAPHKRLLLG